MLFSHSMESHPSKRRRVEYRDEQATEHRALNDIGRKERPTMPNVVLPQHHAFGVHGAARQKPQHVHSSQKSVQIAPTKIHKRELVGTQVSSVVQPAPETASTVLAIAIDNGQGIVSELDVPMASNTVWIDGYGMLTMTNNAAKPTVTASAATNSNNVGSNPGSVAPPPAVAASQARDQARQTQEAIAKQLNVVPQAPTNAPTIAPTPSSAVALQTTTSGQSPLVVNPAESHSQQILSSPPTPVPATPPPSATSSESYFSSLPASVPSSSTPTLTTPPISSQNQGPGNVQSPATSNSTVIATTSTSSSSTVSLSLSSESLVPGVTSSSSITSLAASPSSSDSLGALASATENPSGFSTSTLTGSSFSSSQVTETPTSLLSSSTSASTITSSPTSASSQTSGQSSSIASSGSPSSTGAGAGGVGGTSNTAAAPSPTSSSGSGSGGGGTPPAAALAGGIVGGVAGATLLVLLLFLWLRWRRGRKRERATISPPIPQQFGPGGVPQSGNMTQRSSANTPFAAAGILNRLRPASSQTATTADTGPSERGFQKISGRKLPSVLAAGGDGYGNNSAAGPSTAPLPGGGAPASAAAGPTTGSSAAIGGPQSRSLAPGVSPFAGLAPGLRPGSPQQSLSGSSFYRDSHGFYGGIVPESTTQAETDTASSPSTSPSYPAPLNVGGRSPQDRGNPSNRQQEVAITRPGPARTPVINEPGTIPIRSPSRAQQPPSHSPARGTPPPPITSPFRDGLGRSHPSQDGSRGSRFREDTTPP